jgi:hypothetical protein
MKSRNALAAFAALQFFAVAAVPQSPAVVPLSQIHVIFVAPMASGFDTYVVGELLRRLPEGVTVTRNKDAADAVLQGTATGDRSGTAGTINQAVGVGGAASGAVELVSKSGTILWADEKSDHTIPVFGTFREHGVSKVAGRIAKDLSDAIKDADKREKKAEKSGKP